MGKAPFQVSDVTAEAGTKAFGYLPVFGTSVAMPMTLVNGVERGLSVLVTGGVHGGEYPGIQAAIHLGRDLDPAQVQGQVVLIHIVNPLAFHARQQYLVPLDGKNLNRQFPGRALGTCSERMAHTVMTEVVSKVDAWIDMHGGDIHEALVPFTIYSNHADEDVVNRSRAMAEVYGTDYVLASDSVKGASYGAAAAVGVPCILAEAGQLGRLEEESIRVHTRGCRNVLRHLGVLRGDLEPVASPTVLREFSWLQAEQAGCWYSAVRIGHVVQAGQMVGVIRDHFGEPIAEYHAPATGTILFLVTSLAMNEGDPLMGVGIE